MKVVRESEINNFLDENNIKVIFEEYNEKKGLYKPFKWGEKNTEKLEDHAYRAKMSDVQENDLFMIDQPDAYFSGWFECVGRDDSEKDDPVIMAVPVNDFGKVLTSAQITKKFPDKAEIWLRRLDRYGYCQIFRPEDAEDLNYKVLICDTDYTQDSYTGKINGRKLNSHNWRQGATGEIKHYDEYGRYIGDDEKYDRKGNADVRAAADLKDAERDAAEEARKRGVDNWKVKYGKIFDDAYDPWMGQYVSKDFIKLHPDVDKDTLQKIWDEARTRGNGEYDKPYREFSDEEWEKILKDNNIDPEAINAIQQGSRSSMVEAMANAALSNN